MSVTVRPATADDLEGIAGRNAALASETEGRALDPGRSRAGARAILEDAALGRYWIAEADGAPRGQCLVTVEPSDWTGGIYWWLQSVYVEPRWRGRGIFSALWEAVGRAAAERGDVVALRLYVERANAAARAVYEGLGMRRTPYAIYEKTLAAGDR